jgi:hypothetical protein
MKRFQWFNGCEREKETSTIRRRRRLKSVGVRQPTRGAAEIMYDEDVCSLFCTERIMFDSLVPMTLVVLIDERQW